MNFSRFLKVIHDFPDYTVDIYGRVFNRSGKELNNGSPVMDIAWLDFVEMATKKVVLSIDWLRTLSLTEIMMAMKLITLMVISRTIL